MKLRYTRQAAAELDDVLTYIADRSPQGAKRVQLRLRSVIELLAIRPEIGRRTDLPTLRRVTATPYPYVIFYEIAPDAVTIIGVRHAARDPRTMPDAGP